VADLRVPEGDDRVVERRWDELGRRVREVSNVPRFAEACAAWNALGGRTDPALVEGAIEALASPRKTTTSNPEELALHAFVEGLKGTTKRAKLERLFYSYESRHAFAPEASLLRELFVRCEGRLEEARSTSEGLGFGEVLGRLARLLEARPDVAEEIGARFDALLVDEFQDTSRLQKSIVELLWRRPEFATLACGAGPSKNGSCDLDLELV
jgi:ATP-dependent helicase/nuclease subunit A